METQIKKFFNYLKQKDANGSRIVFLTTSNRWVGDKDKKHIPPVGWF